MKCVNCSGKVQPHHVRHGYDLCGTCQIIEEGTVHAERPATFNASFNKGLGCYIEDRDHFKREKRRQIAAGVIADDGLGA